MSFTRLNYKNYLSKYALDPFSKDLTSRHQTIAFSTTLVLSILSAGVFLIGLAVKSITPENLERLKKK